MDNQRFAGRITLLFILLFRNGLKWSVGEDKAMRERINQISRETGTPIKKVLDLLYTLRTGKPVENNELLRGIGVSKNVLNQVKELLSPLLKPPSKNTQITETAVNETEVIFDPDYKPEEALWSFLENKDYRKSIEMLVKYADQRPTRRENTTSSLLRLKPLPDEPVC